MNHLILNVKPFENGTVSLKRLGIPHAAAILTSSAFESDYYRKGFDVSVPFFNSFTASIKFDSKSR